MSAPLLPGPGEADSWLRRELGHAEYHRSPLSRFADWVQQLLDRIGRQPGRLADLGWPVLLVLALVLVVGLALVLSRLRRNPAVAETRAVFADVRLSAADHRALARAAFEADHLDACVVEAMRAIAAGLVERGLVEDVPAATAHEVVAQAQPRFPALAERMAAAARVFDETRYGDRRATVERGRELLDLESAVAAAAPAGTDEPRTPVAAVPR